MNDMLNMNDRVCEGKEATLSLLCVDSQNVKLPPMIFENWEIDNNKKVNGQKRQILVRTGAGFGGWKSMPQTITTGLAGSHC